MKEKCRTLHSVRQLRENLMANLSNTGLASRTGDTNLYIELGNYSMTVDLHKDNNKTVTQERGTIGRYHIA